MSGCLCIRWPGGAGSTACFFQWIMLRRGQTAAVGLCRGVYVFIGRVAPVLQLEMCHIIHAEMLSRLFMDFSAGCFSLSRPLCSVNLSWRNFARKTTSRGTISHIIPNYPRAHYNAELNTSAAVCRRRYLVSVRNLSIRCACNQTRVCRRKGSGRRVQTAAVGLCRGVYVFVDRVAQVLRSEICHIIHAEMLSRLFMGFSAGCFSLSRPLCSVNLSWTNFARKTTSRGNIPHIIPNYPRAHYNAGLNTSAAVCRRRYLVSVRNLSIRCACNQCH